jgi:uncharacterized alpha-E superfamily protein
VNVNLMLDSTHRQQDQWQALVNTTGDHEEFAKRYTAATKENVIRFLTFDRENLNSIYCCVRAARENARSIRDVISSDMWEQINAFYLMLNEGGAETRAIDSPYEFFNHVRMASHLIVGVTDSTLSHGEGWHFCQLGRFVERTDKTSRILDVKYYMLNTMESQHDPNSSEDIQWGAVLKSASALEMYRKHYRRIEPPRVVEFLLLNREFPRSVYFCLQTAQKSLGALSAGLNGAPVAHADELLKTICGQLSATKVETVLDSGLHHYLDALQTRLNEVGEAVHAAFFAASSTKIAESMGQSQA